MVNLLGPREGEPIYDPACGTGGMLLEAIHRVKENHGDDRTLWGKLFGQEKNLTTSALARMDLFLHGASDSQIVRGDTLRSPAFFSGDNLATFDCASPIHPSRSKSGGTRSGQGSLWPELRRHATGQERRLRLGAAHDPLHGAEDRPYGVGPAAWRALPHGCGRQDSPEDPRHGPPRRGHWPRPESVLRHWTGRLYFIFRQRKAPNRQSKVLILDASKQFKSGRAQNELLPEHVERIHGWYDDYQDVAGVARVVTLEEVAANDYNLNIPRYVEPLVDQEVLTVEEAMQRLQASAEAAFAAEDKLIACSNARDFCCESPSPASPRCIIIAGPNGAGKTTFAQEFLPHDAGIIHFVNADLIASCLRHCDPNSPR